MPLRMSRLCSIAEAVVESQTNHKRKRPARVFRDALLWLQGLDIQQLVREKRRVVVESRGNRRAKECRCYTVAAF